MCSYCPSRALLPDFCLAVMFCRGKVLNANETVKLSSTVHVPRTFHAEPGWTVASAGDVDGDGRDEIMTSNYANHKSYHTVWVLEYTGTGVNETSVSYSVDFHHLRLTCSPNPFSNSTTITLWGGAALAGDGRGVLLGVYDVAGRLLRTLEISGRSGQVVWHGNAADGNKVHGGVYFVKAISPAEVAPAKVVVVK